MAETKEETGQSAEGTQIDVDSVRSEGFVQGKEKGVAAERQRLTDLLLAFEEDRDFAVEQFQSGASIDEAKIAYNEVLKTRLADVEAENKALASKVVETTETSQPAGAAPVPAGGDPAAGQDFMELVRARAEEKGIKKAEAMSEIAREQPGLAAAHRASLGV